MRKILVLAIAVLFLLTSCQPAPLPATVPSPTPPPTLTPTLTPVPHQPTSLADAQRIASAFEKLERAQRDAWESGDASTFRAAYTADAVMLDKTFGDHFVGIDQIVGIFDTMLVIAPSWTSQVTDRYIGLEEEITVDNLWNLELGGYKFTQADPLVEVDWLQTRDDRISYWTLFYTLDSLEKIYRASSGRLAQAGSLLSSYQSAWSSGDPQALSRLYAIDAVREDSLFGERQSGREAVASFARSFFAWYPGTQWSLSLVFGEGRGDAPGTGGLFTIPVSDSNGWRCEVRVAVLLQTSQDQITRESLFYALQSLIKCGWAR